MKIDKKFIEKSIRDILIKGIGLSENDSRFKDTPKRVANLYHDFFKGLDSDDELNELMEKHFPVDYSGIIIKRNIQVFSLCPHHLLPSIFSVSVGFIPNKRTTGFSNITKMIEVLGKKPILQENFTQQIIENLNKWLEPEGSICIVHGDHTCVKLYGIKHDETTTRSSSGVFLKEPEKETQFIKMISEDR